MHIFDHFRPFHPYSDAGYDIGVSSKHQCHLMVFLL
jgi:hypothetical protein